MDKHPVAWGLDIGHSSIKAVKLSRVGTTVTVLGYTIEPIVVAENGDRDEAVVKAMTSMALREDIGATPVLAALSGRQVLTRTVNIPTLNAKKVDRMVELEARQQIPGNFDEIEWGYHLSPAADGASNDVALFAVKRDLTQELIQKSKQAGINLVGVSVSSLALYNFVRYDQVFPDDEAVIILDVGAENTDLVVYQGESLWMRTLAVSGNDITKAFMKKFRVSFDEAETLKRQAGDSRQADKIIKVIEGSLNELTAEVQRSLGFYKSQSPNAKLENLVISGSTFRLPGLPEYMAERLRYTVNILEDLDKIKVAQGLEREHFLNDLPALGVAMGLALQATGVSKANVNLMPSTLQVQNLLNSKRWAAIAAIVLLGVAYGISYGVVSNVVSQNEGLIKKISSALGNNKDALKKSEGSLNLVGPAARKLQQFDVYGRQTGLATAVLASVTGVVQSVVTDKGGAIGDEAVDAQGNGDPFLQAVYLQKVEFKESEAGVVDYKTVFHPLAEAREVTVSVSIPKKGGPERTKEIINAIRDRLRAVKAEFAVAGISTDKAMFTNVDPIETGATGQDDYWYTNEYSLDEKGSSHPIHDQKKIPVTIAVYKCTLPQEAAK
jgi:type IV pilus assembly protein PilM